MEEIEFKQPKKADVSYVPYVPPMVKTIEGSSVKPPLCKLGAGVEVPRVYEVDNFRFFCFLHFVDVTEQYDEETPLAMCKYVKPAGEKGIYSMTACRDANVTNARREAHNKFIVDTFRQFMPAYDCGMSGGRMTMPEAPPDFSKQRKEALEKMKKDQLQCAKMAIEYLAAHELYCGKDFAFDKAFEKANDVAYEEAIREYISLGRIRVNNIPGRIASWWDGVSATDELGQRVCWKRDEFHTFATPSVHPEADVEPEPQEDDIVDEEEQQLALTTAITATNPFDDLFKKTTTTFIDVVED